MNQKITKYERIAGAFVLLLGMGFFVLLVTVIIQKGWLSSKARYYTELQTASGIHTGTQVVISGLRAGWVESVDFESVGKVRVTFEVLKKYQKYVTVGTEVQVVRPFIVGEKVLELKVGDGSQEMLALGSKIPNLGGIDLVDVLSGRLLGPLLDDMMVVSSDIRTFTDTMRKQNLDKNLAKAVSEFSGMVTNMSAMGRELSRAGYTLNKSKRLERLVRQTENITTSLNQILPSAAAQSPEIMSQLPQLVANLTELSNSMRQLAPMMESIPDLPETSRRAAEAIDESVVLMKAMQRFFFIDGKVKDVREEEAEQRRKRKAMVDKPPQTVQKKPAAPKKAESNSTSSDDWDDDD